LTYVLRDTGKGPPKALTQVFVVINIANVLEASDGADTGATLGAITMRLAPDQGEGL
jgi:hypothetical protein